MLFQFQLPWNSQSLQVERRAGITLRKKWPINGFFLYSIPKPDSATFTQVAWLILMGMLCWMKGGRAATKETNSKYSLNKKSSKNIEVSN